ncbi:MarR family winged helix-turn-helix transcriptional regulator [Rhizorhapis sp. SPR117]|uniref:MarR family winged helix-turn-helix transcriptional regulator n=1 Tax=Rhizorhapis sp. SPR117 TaxID=2912611 RepID=UPI001F00A8B7|nr:MarR family transcriptional regulator [Rhizorhapis sp. SPR117]
MDMQLSNATLRALRRILRASDRGGRKLASTTGLTPSQLLVLQEIERRVETTPTIIASSLQFGQATVTNIVDRLTAAGYVTRQRGERDKRQMLLRTTDTGRDVLNAAPDMLQEQFRDRFAALPQWEQAMILAALERLGELLDATDIDAAPLIDAGAIDRSLA